MSYRLIYTRRDEKDIKKLDPSIKKHIGKFLMRLQENPNHYSEKLSDPRIGAFRYRIGDYRVILDLEGQDIIILRVGHRREIYRQL